MRSKKFISLLVLLCLCVGLMTSAYAAGTELTVEAPRKLPAVGKTFELTVSISGNPGLGAVQFVLGYDKSVVECVSAKLDTVLKGAIVGGTNPSASSGAKFAAVAEESFTGNGKLATCTFKVLKSGEPAFVLKDVALTKPDKTAVSFTTKYKGVAEQDDPKPGIGTGGQSGGTQGALFTDVTDSHWAADYIRRAVDVGLIIGNTDGSFNPEGSVTRAQFVTMLWRMSGKPASSGKTPFTDIADLYAEFKSAIAWASEKGYVSGITTTTTFGPNQTITRQQAMTILFRYSGEQSGGELMFGSIYDGQYTDSASISAYAKPGVYWAVYNGIVTGVTTTTIVPHGTATRAQTTVILTRYMEKFLNGQEADK